MEIYKRILDFIENVQVCDALSQEEKEIIINICKEKLKTQKSCFNCKLWNICRYENEIRKIIHTNDFNDFHKIFETIACECKYYQKGEEDNN